MTQNELNRAAGLASGYVSQLESGARGRRPGRDQVLKLARGLGASVKETERLLRASGHLNGTSLVPEGRQSFEAFVAGDPLLTRENKDMLNRLYRSYVPRDR